MRTSRLLLAGAGIAAATAAGSAFTAGNDVAASVAGYGEAAVTGVEVTDIDYTPLAADHAKLDKVTFTTTENVAGRVATMTLRLSAGTAPIHAAYECDVSTNTTGASVIECAATDNPLFAAFTVTGLTVLDQDA
jgi:hypothetical protein